MNKVELGERSISGGGERRKSIDQSTSWGLRRVAKSVSGREVGFSSWSQAASLVVGQVIIAREVPVVQGIVLGKSKVGESVRVLTASFTQRKTQYKVSISDIPFFFIPSQLLVPDFGFSEIEKIRNRIKEYTNKVGFKRSREEELVQWIEEGCVGEMGKKEVIMEESEVEVEGEVEGQDEEGKVEGKKEKDGVGIEEIGTQVIELTRIVSEIVNRQKKDEKERMKVKEEEEGARKKSKEEVDWGELTERVEKMKMEKEKGRNRDTGAGGRRKNRKSDEDEESQVSEGEIVWLECPFKRKHKRQVSYRSSHSQRKLIRRLLEEIYGGHETAAQAASSILGNYELDGRQLTWEESQMMNYARILDIVLVGSSRGPWTTWNEGAVDMIARSFFEMVARVRPGQEVVDIIELDWQKKLKEMNFGKNRVYGPITYRQKGYGRGQGSNTWGWKGYNNVQGEGEGGWANRGGWKNWQGGEEAGYAGRGQWKVPKNETGTGTGQQIMGQGLGWNNQGVGVQEGVPNVGMAGQQVGGYTNQISVIQPGGRGVGNFAQWGAGRGWG